MSQLPIEGFGRPPAGRMVDGMTWDALLRMEKEKRHRYENGIDSMSTWRMHQADFARKREQFFR